MNDIEKLRQMRENFYKNKREISDLTTQNRSLYLDIVNLQESVLKSGQFGVPAKNIYEQFVKDYSAYKKADMQIDKQVFIPVFQHKIRYFAKDSNNDAEEFAKNLGKNLHLNFRVFCKDFDISLQGPIYLDTPLSDGSVFKDNLKFSKQLVLSDVYLVLPSFVGNAEDLDLNIDTDEASFRHEAISHGVTFEGEALEVLRQSIITLQKEKEQQ